MTVQQSWNPINGSLNHIQGEMKVINWITKLGPNNKNCLLTCRKGFIWLAISCKRGPRPSVCWPTLLQCTSLASQHSSSTWNKCIWTRTESLVITRNCERNSHCQAQACAKETKCIHSTAAYPQSANIGSQTLENILLALNMNISNDLSGRC